MAMRTLIFALTIFVAGCHPPTRSIPKTAEEAPGHAHVHAEQTQEPTLPPILKIFPDPADPELFTVEIAPHIEGQARLSVRSDRPVAWLTRQTAGPLALRRGDAPRREQLRVPVDPATLAPSSAVQASEQPVSGVIVDLEIADEAGNVIMNISEEVPVTRTPSKMEIQSPSQTIVGVDANGRPVSASVPASAPAPEVGEAAQ